MNYLFLTVLLRGKDRHILISRIGKQGQKLRASPKIPGE